MVYRSLAVSAILLLTGCAALPGAGHEGYLSVETLGFLGEPIVETSGLALDGESIWTLNDSGNGPWVYKLSPTGNLEKRVRLEGGVNIDWESMAADESSLFVADCGNNSGRREWLELYTVSWDALRRAAGESEVPASRIEFRLSDAAPVLGAHAHDNDCEAIAAVDGKIWMLTKGWQSSTSRLYTIVPDMDGQSVVSQETWPVEGLTTGMDYSPRRNELVVLGYTYGRLNSDTFIWRVPVSQGRPKWVEARRYMLWPSGQWEAIAWRGDDLLLTRESSLLGEARLGLVRLQ
ncbi:hypothetical protein ADIMK_1983 [Marinobacterium lacunae]|uniref:Integral membrane protein n=1 Tax=Marinobacterium lacunae TaxID=1232683 RepID=A0A081FZA1_9GAMM|nr:hypothetical protein [Marinobacterium lacunae]KEA63856.1 hypothetical protein ADIMK_1983 [Marinobacterium lacunae]